jgi:flagellar motor switch protein FliN/FliY
MERFNDAANTPIRQDALDDEAEPYPVQFSQLEVKQPEEREKDVGQFENVTLTISAELGRVQMRVRDILDLKEGSLIETDKPSGYPMEIYVNDQLFGQGEVVVMGDNLAVRITALEKMDEKEKRER